MQLKDNYEMLERAADTRAIIPDDDKKWLLTAAPPVLRAPYVPKNLVSDFVNPIHGDNKTYHQQKS